MYIVDGSVQRLYRYDEAMGWDLLDPTCGSSLQEDGGSGRSSRLATFKV